MTPRIARTNTPTLTPTRTRRRRRKVLCKKSQQRRIPWSRSLTSLKTVPHRQLILTKITAKFQISSSSLLFSQFYTTGHIWLTNGEKNANESVFLSLLKVFFLNFGFSNYVMQWACSLNLDLNTFSFAIDHKCGSTTPFSQPVFSDIFCVGQDLEVGGGVSKDVEDEIATKLQAGYRWLPSSWLTW